MSVDHMEKKPTRTNTTSSATRINFYRGKNLDGSIKLQIGGASYKGHGIIRSKSAMSMTTAEQSKKKSSIADLEVEARLICYGSKSGKRYIFVGRVERIVEPKSTASAAELFARTPDDKAEASLIESEPQTADRAIDSDCGKADARQLAFSQQMQRVREITSVGKDPGMPVDFLCIYLGESRATLYRKMAMTPPQFPLPIKRGGRNFWPLSVIECYSKGEWSSHLDQGISASSEVQSVQH